MLQVRGFLAVAPEERLLGLLALLPNPLEYSLLPKWFKETSPEGPGAMFSSAHWKKPHCCSRGLEQVWNCRPLLGPSFCTVRVTAGWSHLQTVLPPELELLFPKSSGPQIGRAHV